MRLKKTNLLALPFWETIIKLLILNLLVFTLIIIIFPARIKVQYIPDDAFYYLTLSRNYSHLNYWTFDSGISLTSGFHLLFAYLLFGIFELLQPNPETFVVSGIFLSSLFTLTTVLIGASIAFKQKNVLFLLLFALVISSQNFIFNAISITEWSLTLLCALLYCSYFFHNARQNLHLWNMVGFFSLGCLGSLSRTDFGLLPFSIALTAFFLYILKTIPKKQLFFSIVGLFGAIVGVMVGFAHNFFFTQDFLQSSAKMKAYWADVLGPSYLSLPILVTEILGTVGSIVIFFILIRYLGNNYTTREKCFLE